MNLDYAALKFWLDLSHWIGLILVAIWAYLRTKDNDNAKAVKSVADELTLFIKASTDANHEQNNRLTILEQAVEHLPTADKVAEISSAVASVKQRLDGQSELLRRLEHQTNLIHSHLLKAPK
jgi:hypothetical protein